MSQNKQNGPLAAQTSQNSPAVYLFNNLISLGFCVQPAGHEKNLSQLDSPLNPFPQSVQKSQVQGAKKGQSRSVFIHTREFELFAATQQLGNFQRTASPDHPNIP
ncbi:hypothetical protein [Desulfonatronum thioautotrophicum]|uniref:hypothetical protein n=1 Tax=Desulfonatronum thioautotrophicum TaxID=617001 RepID=UPI0012947725|nr:hypothetical protein [Desulfonatronum thioautotrophicum]